MDKKDATLNEHGLVALPETWDAVAKSYRIELEQADYQLADAIEKKLLENGLKPGDSLIEMGCGSGHISACLAQKGYRVTLVDFSPVALEKAKLTFEHYSINGNFIQSDLLQIDRQIEVHDFAWNSGVMEHFGDKELVKLMQNIAPYASKGVLYLMPNITSIAYLLMRARLMSNDEWIYGEEYLRNDYDVILKDIGYKCVKKSYISTSDISAYQIWQAEKKQGNISELYRLLAEEYMLPDHEGYLVAYFASNNEISVSEPIEYAGTAIQDTRLFDLVAKKIGYAESQKEISFLTQKNSELEKLLKEKNLDYQNTYESFKESEQLLEKYKTLVSDYQNKLDKNETDFRLEKEKIQHFEKQIEDYEVTIKDCQNKIKSTDSALSDCKSKIVNYENIVKSQENIIANYQHIICNHENTIKNYEFKVTDYENTITNYKCILSTCEDANADYKKVISAHENTIADYEHVINNQKSVLADYEAAITNYEHLISECNNHLRQATNNIQYAQDVLSQKDEYLHEAKELCNHFATGKLMQLNHLLFRIKAQIINGTKEDRKLFYSWIKGRIKKTNRNIGEGAKYNPWMFINQLLSEACECRYDAVPLGNIENTPTLLPNKEFTLSKLPKTEHQPENISTTYISNTTDSILQEEYTKHDVIILSVIDYDFRHQRPQHFASRFAQNGHRVFYVNANFVRPDSVILKSPNLYLVDFACNEYNAIYAMDGKTNLTWMKEKLTALINTWAIRDAVIIVDYPNWVYGAEYVRNKFGFKIATDYMDDYTGFLGTAEDFLKDNCVKLLKDSDIVIASSQFLYDVACKYTNADKITIIRNGTEVDHFYQAVQMEKSKQRKVIGYYGAVAHWFAWEKICYLAKTMPEHDIVIVGAVTEHREKMEKYPNIKLLGEKPYNDLPKYLADFDVCLIPFDTSTDLIKATNPVKFYEYLSAGKKIVATEIPELMPYQNQYVYMSNDDKQFAEYVRICLNGTDTLKSKDECIIFAKDNDWQMRFESFSAACKKKVPLVSIIVLTYNNLDLNKKCISSILNQTAYANYELIIVDNQSTDGTIEYLKELQQLNIPNVTIIFNEQNAGFAGGNNIGILASKGEYLLLLNNDTVVTRGWLTSMVKHLANNTKYGMCNPVTNSIGNESQIVAHYTNMEELARFAYTYTTDHMGEEYTDVDRLPLFATMIKRDVINNAGLLDEEYKIGMFEDDDYTERAKNAGYEIVIVEDAFIHHVNNASFKKLDDEKYKKIFEQNKQIFETKWNKKWTMPKYRSGVDWNTNINVQV